MEIARSCERLLATKPFLSSAIRSTHQVPFSHQWVCPRMTKRCSAMNIVGWYWLPSRKFFHQGPRQSFSRRSPLTNKIDRLYSIQNLVCKRYIHLSAEAFILRFDVTMTFLKQPSLKHQNCCKNYCWTKKQSNSEHPWAPSHTTWLRLSSKVNAKSPR